MWCKDQVFNTLIIEYRLVKPTKVKRYKILKTLKVRTCI